MGCEFSQERINATIDFHGHSCPGLAIGIRAAELALRDVGDPLKNSMVAVSETDMCGVDAIQFLTGCTYGKGNFLHRDLGKMAFSFFNGKTGKGIRAILKPEVRSGIFADMPELMKKEARGEATPEDKQRMAELRKSLQDHIMTIDLDEMFTISALDEGLPRPARILDSLTCAHCGEATMESRTRRMGGETLCIPCFNKVEQKI